MMRANSAGAVFWSGKIKVIINFHGVHTAVTTKFDKGCFIENLLGGQEVVHCIALDGQEAVHDGKKGQSGEESLDTVWQQQQV